jgi:Protein of unknown function (DUF2815)
MGQPDFLVSFSVDAKRGRYSKLKVCKMNTTTLEKPNLRRIRTVPFRMSFPVLPPMPPRKDDAGRETYQLSMLYPPGTDQAPFRAALREAMVVKFGPDPKQWPRIKQTPDLVIKDFDEYNRNAKTPLSGDWKGWLLIRANSTASPTIKPPNVVGPIRGSDGKFPVITDLREIYGGRWARATIDAYHFDIKNKNNGVTFGLSNVQLLKPDKRFAGDRPDAEQDFEDASEAWAGQGDAFEKGGEFDDAKQDSQW